MFCVANYGTMHRPSLLPTYVFYMAKYYLTTYSPLPHLPTYHASRLTFLPTYICFTKLATYLTTYLPLPPPPNNLSIY